MASDFGTSQFHASNDGSSVMSNSMIDGVLESTLWVIIYYILLCIRVYFINKAWILFEDEVNTPWS